MSFPVKVIAGFVWVLGLAGCSEVPSTTACVSDLAVVCRAPKTVPEGVKWFEEAAADLTNVLSKVAGRTIPLYAEGSAPRDVSYLLYFGDTEAAEQAGLCSGDVARAGFRIRLETNCGFIFATTGMGASFGMTEFVQRYLDCYWPTRNGENTAVCNPARMLPCDDFVGKGAIYYTRIYDGRYGIGDGVTDEMLARGRPKTFPKWHAWERRNRLRGLNAEFENDWRVTACMRENHTAFCYLPPEKYAKDHPEYYSLRQNGKRSWEANRGGQLCHTHPDVRRLVAEALIGFAKADRAADSVNYPTVYDFTQLDNAGDSFCFCDGCRSVCDRYDERKGGTREGGATGLQLEFVNDIARRVAKVYPDIKIRVFAYTITTVIPKGIVPEPNVMIQFCDVYSRSDHQRALDQGPFNPIQYKWLKGWCAIAKHMEIWDYLYPEGPDVAVDGIAGDAKIFRDLGVQRMFMETEYRHQPWWELNAFVMAQTYFNPDVDLEQLVDVYCRAAYGAAAPQMRTALDFLRTLIRDNPPVENWSWHARVLPWRNRANIVKLRDLVRTAYAAAGDDYSRGRIAELLSQCADELIRFDRMDPAFAAEYAQAKDDYVKYLEQDLLSGVYEAAEAARYRAVAKDRMDRLNVKFNDMPAAFKDVKESEIVRIDHRGLQGNRVRAAKDDVAEARVSKTWAKEGFKLPIKCDINDTQLKAHTVHYVTPSPAECDGTYHWVKVGVARIGRNSQFCFPADWEFKFLLSPYYVECDGMADDPNWYEFYLSLKTDGKTYFSADRLLMRRVKGEE